MLQWAEPLSALFWRFIAGILGTGKVPACPGVAASSEPFWNSQELQRR